MAATGESEERDSELQDELNEHGPHDGEEAINEDERQPDRQSEDHEQIGIAKEGESDGAGLVEPRP
jgi:hypothetical protein